jgi:LytS/YehU family sensor histidine kinase
MWSPAFAEQEIMMRNNNNSRSSRDTCLSGAIHIIGRIGLSMSGAIGGTFVAAYLVRANIGTFDSTGFIASMVLVGMIGSYLGIDIPRLRRSTAGVVVWGRGLKADPVELLSAIGTLLAAMAALTAVYAIVFDEVPQRIGEVVVGSWWLLGVIMQIGAGSIGRLRLARH